MFHFSKLSQTALAAMCRLGEVYGIHRMSAFAIADASLLPRPIVAKVLTDLARAGLVCGTRGPGGGFQLTKPPEEITLGEIVGLFDKIHLLQDSDCALRAKCCGLPYQCPLRGQLDLMQSQLQQLLKEFSLHSIITRVRTPAGSESVSGKFSQYGV